MKKQQWIMPKLLRVVRWLLMSGRRPGVVIVLIAGQEQRPNLVSEA